VSDEASLAGTAARRSRRSSPRCVSNGMAASRSVRLARTMRWATVASGSRKARAISGVVSPPSKPGRRVARPVGPDGRR
jgi:hypothetical protein